MTAFSLVFGRHNGFGLCRVRVATSSVVHKGDFFHSGYIIFYKQTNLHLHLDNTVDGSSA